MTSDALSRKPLRKPSIQIVRKSAIVSLVTGGAGFLGSHLCERLIRNGRNVICIDDLSTGSQDNIAHLAQRSNFAFIRADVVQPFDAPVDEIYNLACPASPVFYQADPIKTMRTCVMGAQNVLELARRRGAKVLQASTSEVYGDPLVHPQPESYCGNVNTTGPRACYDEGKRAAETLFFDFRRHHGVDAKVVRIFNTYGPKMQPNDGRVVSNFVVQALKREELTIYGSGAQTRSFCFVSDLIDGLTRAMASVAALAGPINLGNPGEFTVLELAHLVKTMTGTRSPIVYREAAVDDPRQRRPDITTAWRELGWAPKVDLRSGLTVTISYFRDKLIDLNSEVQSCVASAS